MSYSESSSIVAGCTISSIAVSLHNDFYAFGTIDEKVYVHETKYGSKAEKEYYRFEGHTMGVVDLAFNASGNRLAVSSLDSCIRLWNIDEGNQLAKIDCAPLQNWKLRFLVDQDAIVSAGEMGRLSYYSTISFAKSREVKSEDSFASALAVSPDGRFVATGNKNGSVFVFDSLGEGRQCSYKAHSKLVRGLCFGSGSDYLFACSDDRTISCFDLSTNKVANVLAGHGDAVNDIDASPSDGRLLASCSLDKSLRVWDLNARKSVASINFHSANVLAVRHSSCGRHLLSGGESGILAIHSSK